MSFRDRLQNKSDDFDSQNKRIEKETFVFSKTEGYGVLNELLADKNVDKIFVNKNTVYVEKKGRELKTNLSFKNSDELLDIIYNLSLDSGYDIDKNIGYINFKLNDGSKVLAILPPYAVDFPILSIRKVKDITGTLESLIGLQCISKEIALFLEAIINLDLNILITGLENSGKTTLLNAMAKKIGNEKRILTLERMPELKLNQDKVIKLCSFDDDLSSLLLQGLKMNPDKVIFSDCDTNSLKKLLEACADGINFIATVKASSNENAIGKIENIIEFSQKELGISDVKRYVLNNIDIILNIKRIENGSIKLSEVSIVNHKTLELEKVFYWDYTDGIEGRFYSCGIKPNFLGGTGFEISDLIFESDYEHTSGSNKAPIDYSDDIDSQIDKLYSYSNATNALKKLKRK